MKKFSAQYIFTNSGNALKRGIITTMDDGTVISVEDTSGNLKESHSVEFYNGIIIPGFVNCHCHLELSHMKGAVPPGLSLPEFIGNIRSQRGTAADKVNSSAFSANQTMFRNGISLCADICNTADTFELKQTSSIKYINLIEVFGIDPSKANKRIEDAMLVAGSALGYNLDYSIVPHSVYSISKTLFTLLHEITRNNRLTSMHFMESESEQEFIQHHSGAIMESYRKGGLLAGEPETPGSHEEAVMKYLPSDGNLILVHNTFVTREIIKKLNSQKNLFWCLCPNSNLYIEGVLPPVRLLTEESCEIVIGTDSLASNRNLSVLEELKTIQNAFPEISLESLIRWATFNGARALCQDDEFGSIESGKKPGLLLVENADLENMKLTNETSVRRLL